MNVSKFVFLQYHKRNPHVFHAYLRYTWQLHKAGVQRKSISMITERIRWESATRGDDLFKINNDYRAFYARLLMWKVPEFRESFQLRDSAIDGPGTVDLHDVSTWDPYYWSKF